MKIDIGPWIQKTRGEQSAAEAHSNLGHTGPVSVKRALGVLAQIDERAQSSGPPIERRPFTSGLPVGILDESEPLLT